MNPPELPENLDRIKQLIDELDRDELTLLNHYIVDRVKNLDALNRAQAMAQFTPGDQVSFTDKKGQLIEAIVVKLNKKTATLISESGSKWNVAPELLTKIERKHSSATSTQQMSRISNQSREPATVTSIGQAVEWTGGSLDAPGFVQQDNADPIRPKIYVWLNDIQQIVGMIMPDSDEQPYDVVEGLKTAIEKPAIGKPGAPSHVRVSDRLQAKALRDAFPTIKVTCAATPEMAELQRNMTEELAPLGAPMTYSETGASSKAIGHFFEAAAELYLAAPWDLIPHDQSLISVTIESLGVKNAPLSVIGQMSQHLGLVLFNNLKDHERFAQEGDKLDRGLSVTFPSHSFLAFDPAKEIDANIRKDITRNGWKVAGPKAYPLLMAPTDDNTMRPITPRDITVYDALCRALTKALQIPQFLASHNGGPTYKFDQPMMTETGLVSITLEAPYPYQSALQAEGAVDSLYAEMLILERTKEDRDWDEHDRLATQLEQNYRLSSDAKGLSGTAGISSLIMEFSFNYLDSTIATLTPGGLEEILYEIIPRKVMMPASEAAAMIEDAVGFFSFLKRSYNSYSAEQCLGVLTSGSSKKLADAMNNPALFGIGKSMLSEGAHLPNVFPDLPPELPSPSATKPKPKDKKSRKKQRSATKKARKKNR